MKNLEGVVSLLDDHHAGLLKKIWLDLHAVCGWIGNSPDDVPHFSYHVAETYDRDSLSATLAELCSEQAPYEVHTAGLGIFTAPKPVVYIALIKDSHLINLHNEIWRRVQDFSSGASPFYAPETWMPHITLAYEDLSPPMIGCLMKQLAYIPFEWNIPVNNLAMFGQTNNVGERPLIRVLFTG